MTDAKSAAPRTEKEAALRVLIEALFEFGDILFEPDGPNGPSLVVNNEPGTEISLTESQSNILKAAGVPVFKEGGDDPSFDGMGNGPRPTKQWKGEKENGKIHC